MQLKTFKLGFRIWRGKKKKYRVKKSIGPQPSTAALLFRAHIVEPSENKVAITIFSHFLFAANTK